MMFCHSWVWTVKSQTCKNWLWEKKVIQSHINLCKEGGWMHHPKLELCETLLEHVRRNSHAAGRLRFWFSANILFMFIYGRPKTKTEKQTKKRNTAKTTSEFRRLNRTIASLSEKTVFPTRIKRDHGDSRICRAISRPRAMSGSMSHKKNGRSAVGLPWKS